MSTRAKEKIFYVPANLHADTANLIGLFAEALAFKLAAAQEKYGYTNNWMRPDWMNICRTHLLQHLEKGDPRDVAAYCAFLWHHGESTAVPKPEPVNQQLLAALKVLRERHQIDDPHHAHRCEFCKQADAALAAAETSKSLCNTCRKANRSCPIYPQETQRCVEYAAAQPLTVGAPEGWQQKAITTLQAVHNKFQSRPYGTGSYIPKNIRDMVSDALSTAPKPEQSAN
jgi:hypothetical protein